MLRITNGWCILLLRRSYQKPTFEYESNYLMITSRWFSFASYVIKMCLIDFKKMFYCVSACLVRRYEQHEHKIIFPIANKKISSRKKKEKKRSPHTSLTNTDTVPRCISRCIIPSVKHDVLPTEMFISLKFLFGLCLFDLTVNMTMFIRF